MQTSITFRNMDAEEWLKDYVDKKLSRIEKYMDKPVIATVTLSIEKFRNVAEVKLSARGINLQGREEAKEMTLAVDTVIDKVERQIKKSKQKMRNHKDVASKSESIDSGAEEYDEYDENSKVVETKKIILEPMSLEDAILEMDESRKLFVMYRDLSTEKVNVIYRRDDGKYVLIETNS